MAQHPRADALSRECRHRFHIGLAELTVDDGVLRAAKEGKIGAGRRNAVKAVVSPALRARYEHIQHVRPSAKVYNQAVV